MAGPCSIKTVSGCRIGVTLEFAENTEPYWILYVQKNRQIIAKAEKENHQQAVAALRRIIRAGKQK